MVGILESHLDIISISVRCDDGKGWMRRGIMPMSSILQTRVSPGNKTQPQLCEWDIAVRHLLVDPMSIAMRRLRHWIDDDGNKF